MHDWSLSFFNLDLEMSFRLHYEQTYAQQQRRSILLAMFFYAVPFTIIELISPEPHTEWRHFIRLVIVSLPCLCLVIADMRFYSSRTHLQERIEPGSPPSEYTKSKWVADRSQIIGAIVLFLAGVGHSTYHSLNANNQEQIEVAAFLVIILVGPILLHLRAVYTIFVTNFAVIYTIILTFVPGANKDSDTEDLVWNTVMITVANAAFCLISWRAEWQERMLFHTMTKLRVANSNAHKLLSKMLPERIIGRLFHGDDVISEKFHSATVMFTDFDNFSTLITADNAVEIVRILNLMFTVFDRCVHANGVYKVETVSSSYVAAAGVPEAAPDHAVRVVRTAIAIMEAVQQLDLGDELDDLEDMQESLKIGINSGPLIAGVVGHKLPRYRLFGDTMNTASRMCSTSSPGKIQISKATHDLVRHARDLSFYDRGDCKVKGKGLLRCFYVSRGRVPSYVLEELSALQVEYSIEEELSTAATTIEVEAELGNIQMDAADMETDSCSEHTSSSSTLALVINGPDDTDRRSISAASDHSNSSDANSHREVTGTELLHPLSTDMCAAASSECDITPRDDEDEEEQSGVVQHSNANDDVDSGHHSTQQTQEEEEEEDNGLADLQDDVKQSLSSVSERNRTRSHQHTPSTSSSAGSGLGPLVSRSNQRSRAPHALATASNNQSRTGSGSSSANTLLGSTLDKVSEWLRPRADSFVDRADFEQQQRSQRERELEWRDDDDFDSDDDEWTAKQQRGKAPSRAAPMSSDTDDFELPMPSRDRSATIRLRNTEERPFQQVQDIDSILLGRYSLQFEHDAQLERRFQSHYCRSTLPRVLMRFPLLILAMTLLCISDIYSDADRLTERLLLRFLGCVLPLVATWIVLSMLRTRPNFREHLFWILMMGITICIISNTAIETIALVNQNREAPPFTDIGIFLIIFPISSHIFRMRYLHQWVMALLLTLQWCAQTLFVRPNGFGALAFQDCAIVIACAVIGIGLSYEKELLARGIYLTMVAKRRVQRDISELLVRMLPPQVIPQMLVMAKMSEPDHDQQRDPKLQPVKAKSGYALQSPVMQLYRSGQKTVPAAGLGSGHRGRGSISISHISDTTTEVDLRGRSDSDDDDTRDRGLVMSMENVMAYQYGMVTLLQCDICGFTPLCAELSTEEIVFLLNDMFFAFDQIVDWHGVYKIETVGDAYICVAGAPTPCLDHAERMARVAIDILSTIETFATSSGRKLQMRVGLHSGACVGGVVGMGAMPRFHFFGENVLITERMETNAEPGRCHVTETTYSLLRSRFEFKGPYEPFKVNTRSISHYQLMQPMS
jgi:class 3 adenylate cyclase